MSNEMNLPDELSDVETLLGQFTPAKSTVDRDVLMYQAGWSAAVAKQQRKSHWILPASAGALAASLLLLITLPARPPQRLDNGSAELPQPIAVQTAPTIEPKTVQVFVLPSKRFTPTAPLLVMRDLALRQEFNELPITASTDENTTNSTVSHRQLLQEFLPNSSRTSSLPKTKSRWWPQLYPGGNS